jgi:hypothetical protein
LPPQPARTTSSRVLCCRLTCAVCRKESQGRGDTPLVSATFRACAMVAFWHLRSG